MKIRCFMRGLLAISFIIGLLVARQPLTLAEETVQQWEIINPEGTIVLPPLGKIEITPNRPVTLEGKTVALLWNAKPNGEIFLSRVGELLAEQVKDVKVVKLWEIDPATKQYGPEAFPPEVLKKVKNLKPAIVIGSQCD